uniref:Uncharacterized protein n=1 Tax=Caenorhabditis japonica TaxID=281687 RepID=A0A8R1IGW1_CAEJA
MLTHFWRVAGLAESNFKSSANAVTWTSGGKLSKRGCVAKCLTARSRGQFDTVLERDKREKVAEDDVKGKRKGTK